MTELSVGLNCPACGGAVEVQEGESVLNCKYCGSTLFIEGDQGIQTIAFKNNVTKESAIIASQGWWKTGLKARDLKRTGKMIEVYPIYIPFWSTTARVAGWVCGYEERRHSDSKGNTHVERVPKEVMILNDYRYSAIACDPGDLGIRSLKNFSGDRSFADFEMIPTFETTSSKDVAAKDAREKAEEWGREQARVPNVTFQRLYVIPHNMSIIYYPIWVVRYSYRNRMYMNTVDGVTGKVLSGRAPGDPLFQSGGGLLLATFAGTNENSAYFALGGFVIGGIILYATYRFFRHGSEIVEGDFSDKEAITKLGLDDLKEISQVLQGQMRGR
jgi:DNA-directed RNA polymerase subunit RPC12/RpoP